MITQNLNALTIHKFKTKSQYDAIKAQGLVSENDICLVLENDIPADEDVIQIFDCGTAFTVV